MIYKKPFSIVSSLPSFLSSFQKTCCTQFNKMRWRWNKTFKGGTPGSQNWLTRNTSKEKMIEALTFLLNGKVGNNICIVRIPPNPRWDAECNKLLLQLLFKKKNIFSLNMPIDEVGNKNANVVDDFIQLLLSKHNTTSSTCRGRTKDGKFFSNCAIVGY